MIELIIIGVVIAIAMQQNKGNNVVQRNQGNNVMQTEKPMSIIWRIILFVIITPILMGSVWLALCIGFFIVGVSGAEDLAMLLSWITIPLALCWILYKSVRTTFAAEIGSRTQKSWMEQWNQAIVQISGKENTIDPSTNSIKPLISSVLNWFSISNPTPTIPQQPTEKKSTNTIEDILQVTHQNNISPETLDLMKSLESMDIGNIESVVFLGANGTIFSSETENIKRLVVYITGKLKKTVFAPEELQKIYNHVHSYITPNLSSTEFETLSKKIEQFVREGGEVKIVTRNTSL